MPVVGVVNANMRLRVHGGTDGLKRREIQSRANVVKRVTYGEWRIDGHGRGRRSLGGQECRANEGTPAEDNGWDSVTKILNVVPDANREAMMKTRRCSDSGIRFTR